MAFYGLIDNEQEEVELPWFNEFHEQNGNSIDKEVYPIEFVKSTPKGYILTTSSFNAWVWRKTTLGNSLGETLAQAIKEDSHPTLAVMVNTKLKTKFSIGLLDDENSNFKWSGESSLFTLHPQKNLPLDIPPDTEIESKGKIQPIRSRKAS